MEVIVDGERNFKFQTEPDTVASALAEIEAYLRQRGRGMQKVAANGENIASLRLVEALGEKSLDEIHTIEVESEDIAKLAASSLRELEEVLPELPTACHSLAEVFQSDSPEEGFEKFDQLAEIWQEVKQRQRRVIDALEIDLEEATLDGLSLARRHDELNRYLGEAASALEVGDCVLLGDLLEYELAPRAEFEAEIVALLQSYIQGRAG